MLEAGRECMSGKAQEQEHKQRLALLAICAFLGIIKNK
jgi:hypothetical protein